MRNQGVLSRKNSIFDVKVFNNRNRRVFLSGNFYPFIGRIFLALAFALILYSPLYASDVYWTNALTGDWFTAGHWDLGFVPQTSGNPDRVHINKGTVNLNAGQTASVYKFSMGDNTGDSATLNVSGSGAVLNLYSARIGVQGSAALNVSNGAKITGIDLMYFGFTDSLPLTNQQRVASGKFSGSGTYVQFPGIYVGLAGIGTLEVTDRATVVTGSMMIGQYGVDGIYGVGSVKISGNGTTWSVGTLGMGNNGTGALEILNGATLASSAWSIVGQKAGSSGTITVDGAGSTWNARNVSVGVLSEGTLNIRNGGTVTNEMTTSISAVSLGYSVGGDGVANVSGAGSVWDTGSLFVGYSGKGTLNLTDHGTVTGNASSILIGGVSGSTGAINVKEATLNVVGISAGTGNASLTITGSKANITTETLNSVNVAQIPVTDNDNFKYNKHSNLGTLKTYFRLDADGISTIHVTGVANITNTALTLTSGTGFQVLRTNRLDLVNAATLQGSRTVVNSTVFENLQRNDPDTHIVRMQFNDAAFDASLQNWDLQGRYRFSNPDGTENTDGLVSGTMRVHGEYTDLAAIFKNLDDVGLAQLLANYLNENMETGLKFSVINDHSLSLTGNYLGDGGYGYFGWDLTGFNGSTYNVSLLGFNEVPEPATWVMLLLALVTMCGAARFRRICKLG